MILQFRQVSTEWFFQSCLESLRWLQLAELSGLAYDQKSGLLRAHFPYTKEFPITGYFLFPERWELPVTQKHMLRYFHSK